MSESEYPRPLTDNDIARVQEYLQHHGLAGVSFDTVRQAIHVIARERSFHPVRDELDSFRWDGKPRVAEWPMTYLGAIPTADRNREYLRGIGQMFLISMIARAFEPGCQCDYMLILEGPQGIAKTTACRVLAGKWFSDQLFDIHTKEASQHLRGKWLIELAELASFKRADTEALKAFITRREEKYRPPYGREQVIEPRQCVFVGTVNPVGGYLKDPTGARRFWPIVCGKIDIPALIADRDQIFAEALDLYRDGKRWWPDADFERDYIAHEQAERFEPDVWETPIVEFLRGKTRTTVLDVAVGALGYVRREGILFDTRGTPINRISPNDSARITACMTHLGWCSRHDRNSRWWEPINAPAPDDEPF